MMLLGEMGCTRRGRGRGGGGRSLLTRLVLVRTKQTRTLGVASGLSEKNTRRKYCEGGTVGMGIAKTGHDDLSRLPATQLEKLECAVGESPGEVTVLVETFLFCFQQLP